MGKDVIKLNKENDYSQDAALDFGSRITIESVCAKS